MSLIKEERVYFYGLDEIRAVAALLVFFHHMELFKARAGFSSLVGSRFFHVFITKVGHNAVIAFFVLSGFLITYLLLVEKEKTGTINVKAFYVRRILRIWPLYFLIVLVGFGIMPLLNMTGLFTNQKHYTQLIENLDYASLPLFILFLSNFALKYFKPVAGASQSWSVSLEEQFYLFWPHVMKLHKGVKQTFIIVVLLLVLKIAGGELILRMYGNTQLYGIVKMICVEYMFIGALAAILLFWKETRIQVERIFKSKILLVLVLLFLAVELGRYNHHDVLAVLFAALILLVINQKIEIKFLKYFGKISYGIYMLHPLVLFISFSIAYNLKNEIAFNFVFYILSFALTILCAGLSYKYFEEPILKNKKKYTIIKSGSE